MYIYKAILKYGYSNFSLEILEYCEPNLLISREQYYIDLLEPEYNILKIAYSSLGFKHSLYTRAKMSFNNTGINLPLYGKKPTYETRIKIGKALRSNSMIDITPNLDRNQSKLNPLSLLNYSKLNIKVFDKYKNIVNIFYSMKSAALYYNISTQTIRKILNNEIIHVGFTYKFEAINRGCKRSEETKKLISNTLKNRLIKLLPVKVTNIETNVINYFPNNKEAAKYLGTSERTLIRYKSKGKIFFKKYIITNNIYNHKSYK